MKGRLILRQLYFLILRNLHTGSSDCNVRCMLETAGQWMLKVKTLPCRNIVWHGWSEWLRQGRRGGATTEWYITEGLSGMAEPSKKILETAQNWGQSNHELVLNTRNEVHSDLWVCLADWNPKDVRIRER